jgi:hypothetical protein
MLKGQTQQSKEDVALTQKVGKRRISLCMILLSLTALLKGLLVVLAKMVSSAISKRPRSPHRGTLSFLGPRSSHTVAQPKPLEGDVTSFWYYRKRLDQVWWRKSSKP